MSKFSREELIKQTAESIKQLKRELVQRKIEKEDQTSSPSPSSLSSNSKSKSKSKSSSSSSSSSSNGKHGKHSKDGKDSNRKHQKSKENGNGSNSESDGDDDKKNSHEQSAKQKFLSFEELARMSEERKAQKSSPEPEQNRSNENDSGKDRQDLLKKGKLSSANNGSKVGNGSNPLKREKGDPKLLQKLKEKSHSGHQAKSNPKETDNKKKNISQGGSKDFAKIALKDHTNVSIKGNLQTKHEGKPKLNKEKDIKMQKPEGKSSNNIDPKKKKENSKWDDEDEDDSDIGYSDENESEDEAVAQSELRRLMEDNPLFSRGKRKMNSFDDDDDLRNMEASIDQVTKEERRRFSILLLLSLIYGYLIPFLI